MATGMLTKMALGFIGQLKPDRVTGHQDFVDEAPLEHVVITRTVGYPRMPS